MLWGRVLVVCCALIAVLSLRRLGHWVGIAVWIFLTLLLPDLFVIRPETISIALILAGLAIWAGPSTSNLLIALAGAAAGAAVYSSPRFLLMGGLFVLLGRQTPMRWVYLCVGGLGFVALYTVLADYPLSEVWFNIQFSAHLQTIDGEVWGTSWDLWRQLLMYTCGPLIVLIAAIRREDRARATLLVAYAVVEFLLCAHLAGMFYYSQALSPFLVSVAIVAAWIFQRVERHPNAAGMFGLGAATVLLVTGIASLPPVLDRMSPLNLFAWIRARDHLAADLPTGEAVLVFTQHTPITVPDISYYGSPLWDGADRLCTAVRTFKTTSPLPKCDFAMELEKLPYYTDLDIKRALPLLGRKEATEILSTDYHVVAIGNGVNDPIEVRKGNVPGRASHP